MKRLVILGSTGSIGRQMLDIVRAQSDVEVWGLAAGANVALLAEQVREFSPKAVSVASPQPLPGSQAGAPTLHGCPEQCSMEEMVAAPEVDIVVVGTVGKAGLAPTLAALRAGKAVALANKEVLVMAGAVVTATAAAHGGTLLPVDSEHSAIWQCLVGEESRPRRMILTASGGALRDLPLDQIASVTPQEALRHPTWNMGPKITVDSATLMNKGFEVIEARWLFDQPLHTIDVIMHRESVVHSLVEFDDGTLKAQLGVPDMRVPLQYALTFPERYPADGMSVDFATLGRLRFEALDEGRYPCLLLALEAARKGGTYPAVLSAADEAAVARFLKGGGSFVDIHQTVEAALTRHIPVYEPDLEDILEADAWARRFVEETA